MNIFEFYNGKVASLKEKKALYDKALNSSDEELVQMLTNSLKEALTDMIKWASSVELPSNLYYIFEKEIEYSFLYNKFDLSEIGLEFMETAVRLFPPYECASDDFDYDYCYNAVIKELKSDNYNLFKNISGYELYITLFPYDSKKVELLLRPHVEEAYYEPLSKRVEKLIPQVLHKLGIKIDYDSDFAFDSGFECSIYYWSKLS